MKNRILNRPLSLLCTFLAISLAPSHAGAQTPMEKLHVAYTVIAPTQLNVWTAKDMGYFAKHGLDVDLVLLVGAPLAVAALVGGETPIVHTGASAVITSNLAGSGAVLFAGAANRFPYVLFVTEQIKRVEDLKGKNFGVSRVGSADHAAAITVFDKLGVKENDITYVQAGSIPARLAAMQTNTLQATLAASAGNVEGQRAWPARAARFHQARCRVAAKRRGGRPATTLKGNPTPSAASCAPTSRPSTTT